MTWADVASIGAWFLLPWATGYAFGYLFKIVRRLVEQIGGASSG